MVTNNRKTYQLLKMKEYLDKVHSHPTAETIYRNLRKSIPTLSFATVYRNLNKLEKIGELIKLEINGEMRFDSNTGSHQHFICRICSSISDIHNERLSAYALKMINSSQFKPDSVGIIYRGICKKCKEAKK
jgi:Fur family peroxide stress response transcriptional regulator